jgi:hypothetical protein
MPHVGTLDVDVGLDAEALGEGEYATLIGELRRHGYAQREGLRRFQLVRQIETLDGGGAIDVVVDFLMPRDAEIVKNNPPVASAVFGISPKNSMPSVDTDPLASDVLLKTRGRWANEHRNNGNRMPSGRSMLYCAR